MKQLLCTLSFATLTLPPFVAGTESEAIAYFEQAGARVTQNEAGHAVKLFSGGKPPHSSESLQQIGQLIHLEQIALNNPQAGDDDWTFLRQLSKLNQLTIWHCKTISSLEAFSGLPIEGLTVGGCMGLRNLNKDQPDRQLNAVLELVDLPNLKRLNLYHSPTTPHNRHLEHIATQFPKLEDLKLDFAAPRGSESAITPEGLRVLKKLPLRVFSLENVQTFTPEHMAAIAEIETLEAVLIDARRGGIDTQVLGASLHKARPDLEVVIAEEGTQSPPRRR